MLGDVDNLSDNVPFLDQFGGMIGLSEMQDFSSTSGKFPQNPLEDQLKAIVKETPKLILKALAEITDPCVMTGKAINDALQSYLLQTDRTRFLRYQNLNPKLPKCSYIRLYTLI